MKMHGSILAQVIHHGNPHGIAQLGPDLRPRNGIIDQDGVLRLHPIENGAGREALSIGCGAGLVGRGGRAVLVPHSEGNFHYVGGFDGGVNVVVGAEIIGELWEFLSRAVDGGEGDCGQCRRHLLEEERQFHGWIVGTDKSSKMYLMVLSLLIFIYLRMRTENTSTLPKKDLVSGHKPSGRGALGCTYVSQKVEYLSRSFQDP